MEENQKSILLPYKKGERLDYYINLSGGYKEDADREGILVHFPDGKVLEGKGISAFNPYLQPGSIIEVPFKGENELSVTADVEVRGAARNPSLIRYRRGEPLDYYINFCGGYLENADSENVMIHLPDGTVVERKGKKDFNPEILPGSIIEVPAKNEKK